MRGGEVPGQPLGGREGSQRVGVPAAGQLEHSAGMVHHHARGPGVGFWPDGALGVLDPGLGLLRPLLPGQHRSELPAGRADGRLVCPAVLFGQVDRLPAPLRRPY